jgi:hypothetical protein
MKPSAPVPQPRLVDRVQVCRVNVADVVTRETSVATQGYVRLPRPFGSGNDSHRYGAQPRDQHIDRQHDDRMITRPWQARVLDITSERVHGLVTVGCNHSSWQRSRLAPIELVVSCLPAATRTHDVLEIETDASAGTSGAVAITSSLGLVSSTPFSNAKTFTSLASIAYPLSS